MSSKNKSQLRTENSTNFPNNNSQFITPERLRNFNNDMIDSLVVSSDSGSFIVTSSFDTGTRDLTFTKGDGSTYTNNIPGGGAGADTGSLLTTASVSDATITFTKGDASTFSIEVDNVTSSLQTQDVFVNVKNTSGSPINKGLAVHATGVTGENINVELADSANSANMPAIGLLETTLANNAVGRAIISGRLKNIDTSGLVAGASVYVNGSGTLTSSKPTGSDLIQNIGICGKVNATEGEIIVVGSGRSNDLPNITEGYIWVGDSNDVPEQFSTGSIAFINKNNTFTGTQSFNNISVSGTGSFGYIEAVTGSAKIIGDAFIILNNDTPTERYAGIKVIDSGSTGATASLQFDGSTNDWFYEYTSSGDPDNFGVVLFGPEYNTIGSPTYNTNNTIPKSDGGHHLNDSNITDDGTTVTINSNLNVTGTYNGFDSSSFAILNQSNTFTGGKQISSGSNGLFEMIHPGSITNNTQLNYITADTATTNGTNYGLVNNSYQNYSSFGRWYNNSIVWEIYDSTGYNYGTATSLNGGGSRTLVLSSGSLTRAGYFLLEDDLVSGQQGTTFNAQAQTINIGTLGSSAYRASNGITIGNAVHSPLNLNGNAITVDGNTTFQSDLIASGGVTFVGGNDFNCDKGAFFNSTTNFAGDVTATSPISSSNYISASAFIGDGSQLTGLPGGGIFNQTGSFQATTNDLQITGSLGVTKAIGGKNSDLTISSLTASIDLKEGNTFTVTLVSSADTHIDVSYFGEDAQSINLLVKQPTSGNTGSISFSPDFKFGGGYSYLPTPANSAEDIVSFTRFGNSLYGTYINNFS